MRRPMEPRGVAYVAVMNARICTVRYMSSFILLFVLFIWGFKELGGSWDLFMLRTCILFKGEVMIRWFGPLGCYVGASE